MKIDINGNVKGVYETKIGHMNVELRYFSVRVKTTVAETIYHYDVSQMIGSTKKKRLIKKHKISSEMFYSQLIKGICNVFQLTSKNLSSSNEGVWFLIPEGIEKDFKLHGTNKYYQFRAQQDTDIGLDWVAV